ncbi:unnamed protein product, partial [Didymodactylos carnosus]
MLYDATSNEHIQLAEKMLELQDRRNQLKQQINSSELSFRRKWIKMTDTDIKFPQLSLDFLREYTCGSYQLKQNKAYAKSYLDEHGSFEVEISPDTDNILRCRIQSRHHNSVEYQLGIEYDQEDDDNPIVDKF